MSALSFEVNESGGGSLSALSFEVNESSEGSFSALSFKGDESGGGRDAEVTAPTFDAEGGAAMAFPHSGRGSDCPNSPSLLSLSSLSNPGNATRFGASSSSSVRL